MDQRQFHRVVLAGAAFAGLSRHARPADESAALPHLADALPLGAKTRLGTTRFRHLEKAGDPGINALAFSPDGEILAALGYQDDVISLWAVPSGRLVREWRADEADRRGGLLFSPCGRYLAQFGYPGLSLWDAETGGRIRGFTDHPAPHIPFVFGAAFSPDGRFIAAAFWAAGAVAVWETRTGTPVARFEADPQPLQPDNPWGERSDFLSCVAFSADGRRVAAGGTYKLLLDPAGPEAKAALVRARESGGFGKTLAPVMGVGIMDRGGLLEQRGRVRCWDAASGHQIARLDAHEYGVGQVAFLPDGRLVSAAEDGEVRVWDVEPVRLVSEVSPSAGRILRTATAFTADGRYGVFSRPGTMDLVDLPAPAEPRRFAVPADWEGWLALAVSADARWVATARQGQISLWDATTGANVSPPGRHLGGVGAVRFIPSGRVITASPHEMLVWDVRTGEMVARADGLGYLSPPTLAISADGRWCACARHIPVPAGAARRAGVLAWEWATGEVSVWDNVEVAGLGWSADGGAVIVLTPQGDLVALDCRTGARDDLLSGTGGEDFVFPPWPDGRLAAAPDRRVLAAPGRGPVVHVWGGPPDWTKQRVVPVLGARQGGSPGPGRVWFSPDGREMVYVSYQGEVAAGPIDETPLTVNFSPPPVVTDQVLVVAVGFRGDERAVARGRPLGSGNALAGWGIEVFDVRRGVRMWESPRLAAAVSALDFAPGGRTLASGLCDGTTLVWDLPF